MEEKNQKKSKKRLAIVISILAILLISILTAIVFLVTSKNETEIIDSRAEEDLQQINQNLECLIFNPNCEITLVEIETQYNNFIDIQQEKNPEIASRARYYLSTLFEHNNQISQSIKTLQQDENYSISNESRYRDYNVIIKYAEEINNTDLEKEYIEKILNLEDFESEYIILKEEKEKYRTRLEELQ